MIFNITPYFITGSGSSGGEPSRVETIKSLTKKKTKRKSKKKTKK